jgi:magnesium transporter
MAMATWIDVLDPDKAELEARWSDLLHAPVIERLSAADTPRGKHGEPRARLERHGDYLFGVLLIPFAVPEEDRVYYQEVNLILTRDLIATVRKTPPGGDDPFDPLILHEFCPDGHTDAPGMLIYHLFDEVAERYLDLFDALDGEIEELDEHVEVWDGTRVRKRIEGLRSDLLLMRRKLAPMRDAVRKVVDKRLDLLDLATGEELFSPEIEVHFADAYDKMLRASEAVEFLRDLLGGVRDYYQVKISNDQNEVNDLQSSLLSYSFHH